MDNGDNKKENHSNANDENEKNDKVSDDNQKSGLNDNHTVGSVKTQRSKLSSANKQKEGISELKNTKNNINQVVTAKDSNNDEENLKQTNDVIRDIMAEEENKGKEDRVDKSHIKKYTKKEMLKKIPFSFSNLDVYFHLKYDRVNVVVRVLIECTIVTITFIIWPFLCTMLTPTKIAFFDHFIKEKTPTNHVSMFVRGSVFFSIGYISYVFMCLFTDNILYVIAVLFMTFGLSIQGVVAEYLQVIRASRKHIRNAIVAIVMFMFGTFFLNGYEFLSQIKDFYFIFFTLLLWCSIISFILFFESFLMNLLTSELRRKSFRQRIWDTNYKTFVIKKLAAIAEATPHGKYRINEIIHNQENEYDTGFFLRYNDLDITTYEAAVTISEGVFGYLEIDELTYESIKTYFPENHDEVYSFLSGTKVTKETESFPPIEYETFNSRCIELYQERVDITRSLYDRDNILRKLDYILTMVVVFCSCIIFMILLNVNYKVFLASLGPLTFGFGWIFQDSIKEIYRCFVFLLINHPFDCGDRIKIDSEDFTVLKIDLMYTTCTTMNGKIKYLPNAALFLKPIENIRRSDLQAEDVFVNVASDTTFVQMLDIRDKLTDFAKRNDKDFTGKIWIKNYELAGSMMNIIFTIEHTSNFQDIKPRLMRRDMFVKQLEELLDAEKIVYTRCYKAVD